MAGAFLRLVDLSRVSLWLDEGFTFMVISNPWTTLHKVGLDIEKHPVGYYYLAKFFFGLTPTELGLRLPAALCGLLTVPATFWLARTRLRDVEAAAAALLVAVSSMHVLVSRDARSYTLACLFLVLASWAWMQALDEPEEPRYWWAWVGCGLVAVYSHYFSFSLLVAQWCYGLSKAPLRRLCALTVPAVLVAYVPGLIRLYTQMKAPSRGHNAPNWLSPVETFFAQGFGYTLNFSAMWQWYALAFVGLALVVWALRQEPALMPLGVSFLGATLLTLVVGAVASVFLSKYTVLVAPFFWILVVAGSFRLPGLWPGLAVLALYVGLNVTSVSNHIWVEEWHQQDFRWAARVVEFGFQPGDVVLVEPDWSAFALAFYAKLPVRLTPLPPATAVSFALPEGQKHRIWLVRSALYHPASRVVKVMEQERKLLMTRSSVRRNPTHSLTVSLFGVESPVLERDGGSKNTNADTSATRPKVETSTNPRRAQSR